MIKSISYDIDLGAIMSPTTELYSSLQLAFDHFNVELFDNKLPQILFTNQRQHGVMGYFAADRWTSVNGKNCHEIAINPLYVGKATLIELMQTLVHEMTHCWQHCHGKPSHKYHNKEWAKKMISIGLMPSTTGKPGGAIVGQHMNDYPAKEGMFIKSCFKLLKDKDFKWPWVDRLAHVGNKDSVFIEALDGAEETLVEQLTTRLEMVFGEDSFAVRPPQTAKKTKVKYNCGGCKLNVWGKPGLQIRCDECDQTLAEGV